MDTTATINGALRLTWAGALQYAATFSEDGSRQVVTSHAGDGFGVAWDAIVLAGPAGTDEVCAVFENGQRLPNEMLPVLSQVTS